MRKAATILTSFRVLGRREINCSASLQNQPNKGVREHKLRQRFGSARSAAYCLMRPEKCTDTSFVWAKGSSFQIRE